MKIFVICSKYFYDQIKPIATELEKAEHICQMPNSYEDPFKENELKKLSAGEHQKWKETMLHAHHENVNKNDAVLVLNFEKNNQPNYIGGGTFLEVAKAFELRKKIFFYNPLPECIFTDELKGMNPTIINGDLTLIK